jgi:hypothetical protein
VAKKVFMVVTNIQQHIIHQYIYIQWHTKRSLVPFPKESLYAKYRLSLGKAYMLGRSPTFLSYYSIHLDGSLAFPFSD